MRSAGRIGWLLAVIGCTHGAPSSRGSALTLEVTPARSGVGHATLRSGDQVVSGDGIQVAVKPTVDAHVYLGYCDRNHQLAIFPGVGGIEAKAGRISYAPARDASIVLDDQVGPEVLYVIASRRPLDVADPELAAAIARAGQDAGAKCGAPLDRVLAQGRPPAVDEPRADPPPPRADAALPRADAALPRADAALPRADPASPRADAALPRADPAPPPADPAPPPAEPAPPRAAPAPSRTSRPRAPHAPSRVPPPADLQRGGFLRWGASGAVSADGDRDDIVVLRYRFTHVAPAPAPVTAR